MMVMCGRAKLLTLRPGNKRKKEEGSKIPFKNELPKT
jgi:hypothetical protein